ncbi:MAG: hypothetical protein ACPGQL_02325 [Thermoplasmatota archaeon]
MRKALAFAACSLLILVAVPSVHAFGGMQECVGQPGYLSWQTCVSVYHGRGSCTGVEMWKTETGPNHFVFSCLQEECQLENNLAQPHCLSLVATVEQLRDELTGNPVVAQVLGLVAWALYQAEGQVGKVWDDVRCNEIGSGLAWPAGDDVVRYCVEPGAHPKDTVEVCYHGQIGWQVVNHLYCTDR